MDITVCKEKGCLRQAEHIKNGEKVTVNVCELSGEEVADKVCHIYDDVKDMKVRFNRITISKKKVFLEADLMAIRGNVAEALGVDSSDVYFNYSRIGDK